MKIFRLLAVVTALTVSLISQSTAHAFTPVNVNGTKLAFISNRTDGAGEIYLVNPDGTNLTKAAGSVPGDRNPVYSPDGTKIYFDGYRNSETQSRIYSMNADGTNVQAVTDLSAGDYSPTYSARPLDRNGNIYTIASGKDYSAVSFTVGSGETLVVDGSAGNVAVGPGGFLKGHGTVGSLHVNGGGTLSPGNSPGCLTAGPTTISGNIDVELGGTTACSQYDQLLVNGTVDLTNSTLNVIRYNNFQPVVGNSFTIINNDGNDSVIGTFAGLAQGASFSLNGYTFQISYNGGDGNDVVVTVTAVATNAPTNSPQSVGVPNTGFNKLETKMFSGLLVVFISLVMYELQTQTISRRWRLLLNK